MTLTQLPGPPQDGAAHLRVTGALDAQNAGFWGGPYVGFFDSGALGRHPVMDQHLWYGAGYDLVDRASNNYSVDDANGHGTAVAQMVVGRSRGGWGGGVAPEGDLSVLRIIPDKPTAGNPFGQPSVEAGLRALEIGLEAKSAFMPAVGFSWEGDFHWQDPKITERLYKAFATYVAWSPYSPSYDGLVVFASGDGGHADPAQLAALPSQPGVPEGELEQNWITVAAVETAHPDRLASYSNACGVAMDYCMVAPGDVVVTGPSDSATTATYWSVGSTHMASPQVLGAVSTVWGAFPYLSGAQVRQVLLGTATDLGAPGTDPVFGHGLLNVGKAVHGPARFDWGDMRVDQFDPKSGTVWSNDISGEGGLIKRGGGDLTLAGNNTYTGDTTVQMGSLIVTGAITSNVLVLANSSWDPPVFHLKGGTVKGNVVSNAVFNKNGGTARIEGNYTQESTAALWTDLGAPPLHVTGTATLNGGYLFVTGVAPGYTYPQREILINAEGGLSGTFSGIGTANLLLQSTFGYDGTSAWLDITRVEVTAAATSAGVIAPAAVSSATRLEGAFQQIDQDGGKHEADAFVDGAAAIQRSMSAEVLSRSLDSLSGELHDADSTFAMMAIEGGRHALESRLDDLQGREPAGAWSQQLDGKRGWSSFDVDASGWMLGLDQRHGSGMVGVALAETDGNAWHSQRYDRERNRQVEGQLYASWNVGSGYVLGTAGFGHMQRWLNRDIALGADAYRVSSDYAHRYGSVALQAGRRFELGGNTLTPYAGAQALQLDRDAFSEQGAAGFGLTSEATSMSATQALLGARFGRAWRGESTRWQLQGRLEWQHLLSQSDQAVSARFTGMEAWAPIVGAGLDRDVGVFGLGLEAGIGHASRISVDLDSRYSDGQQWTGAQAKWSMGW